MTSDRIAVVVAGDLAAMHGEQVHLSGPVAEIVERVAGLEGSHPRWVFWSAERDARPIITARLPISRSWDIAEVHRLIHGGWHAEAGLAWAGAHRLSPDSLPTALTGDLFDFATSRSSGTSDDELVLADGHLRPEAVAGSWLHTVERLALWARAAYDCSSLQLEQLGEIGPRAVSTAHSESAAALLCEELARDGLPVDRVAAERLIREAAGPRAETEVAAVAIRRSRDQQVLAKVPGREATDLRNPLQVKEMLASVGVVVPNTRKWVIEPFRDTHPVVAALLDWRKAERIATTYGYAWLDAHVGLDDRLRGGWTACDGGAGRMTAQNGLHNLPAVLRPAIAAHPGHVFVRADLGQIEPRVLAAVSGDERFAVATQADDLYAPVAATLEVDRAIAKVAVLAAMYGQRSGAAGEALKGLERAYPVAMGFLDRAYAAGVGRQTVRTFGGRAVRSGGVLVDGDPVSETVRDGARGRYIRNAVVQGAAAELFKAWAATVRATTGDLDAQIVLCLHDELLLHVPEHHAVEASERVEIALRDSARRWTGSSEVRFVADTSVIRRWSEAKN